MRVRLIDIAHARSGDKGDMANVGVIARQAAWYAVIDRYLTADLVAAHLGTLIAGRVVRYELPNLGAVNFLLYGALDGGGTRSLRIDAQGKVLSSAILRLMLEIPDDEARVLGLPVAG